MSRSSALQTSYTPSQPAAGTTKSVDSPPSAQDETESHIIHLETLLLGGLYWPAEEVEQALAPRDGCTIRVLDIGSASGVWAAEMARKFPHIEVIGIDKAPIQPANTPPNCGFEALDIATDDATHLGVFDVVHCRRYARRTKYYKALVSRVVRTIKPGGLYLHYEGDMSVYDENKRMIDPAIPGQELGNGSYFARVLHEIRRRVPVIIDMPIEGFGDSIRRLLGDQPSLENLQAKSVYAPVGSNGSEDDKEMPDREEIGQLMNTVHLERARGFRSILISGGLSAETVDLYLREAEADIQTLRGRRFGAWHFFAARVKQDEQGGQ